MKKDSSKHYLLIEVDKKTKNKFKSYCAGQGVSMKLGLNVLMAAVVEKNFSIHSYAQIKMNEHNHQQQENKYNQQQEENKWDDE